MSAPALLLSPRSTTVSVFILEEQDCMVQGGGDKNKPSLQN